MYPFKVSSDLSSFHQPLLERGLLLSDSLFIQKQSGFRPHHLTKAFPLESDIDLLSVLLWMSPAEAFYTFTSSVLRRTPPSVPKTFRSFFSGCPTGTPISVHLLLLSLTSHDPRDAGSKITRNSESLAQAVISVELWFWTFDNTCMSQTDSACPSLKKVVHYFLP